MQAYALSCGRNFLQDMIVQKRILILAPHTDDGEFGCGGTISKLQTDNEIYYAAFSSCEESVPSGFDKNILKEEVKQATGALEIPSANLSLFNFSVRRFSEKRQEILDQLIGLRTAINPQIVFTPCRQDVHQDHQTITSEAIRAFKFSTILGYELPWNNLQFNNPLFIALTDSDIGRKVFAIGCYKSQANRSYSSAEFIRSLAKVRGVQAGVPYAESFEIIRMII